MTMVSRWLLEGGGAGGVTVTRRRSASRDASVEQTRRSEDSWEMLVRGQILDSQLYSDFA